MSRMDSQKLSHPLQPGPLRILLGEGRGKVQARFDLLANTCLDA